MATRKTLEPVVVPRLADGSVPMSGVVVRHPDGTQGPISWTAPRRGCDRPTVPADWQCIVRSGPRSVRRPTRELTPC